jgi:hypothetical protein
VHGGIPKKDPDIHGIVNIYGATKWEHYMDEGGGSLESFFEKLLPVDDLNKESLKNKTCRV